MNKNLGCVFLAILLFAQQQLPAAAQRNILDQLRRAQIRPIPINIDFVNETDENIIVAIDTAVSKPIPPLQIVRFTKNLFDYPTYHVSNSSGEIARTRIGPYGTQRLHRVGWDGNHIIDLDDDGGFPPAPDPSERKVFWERPAKEKWAIVVGLSKFSNQGVKNIAGADNDAISFAKLLKERAHFKSDNVVELVNDDAKVQAIKSKIGSWLPNKAMKDDLVVVYLSTHGSPPTENPAGEAYLYGYDTNPSDLINTAINIKTEIIERIKEAVPCERVVLIIDACYSGAAGSYPKLFDPKYHQLLICSSKADQSSFARPDGTNSTFTGYLLDLLSKNNMKVTLADRDKLGELVIRDSTTNYSRRQFPRFAGPWMGVTVDFNLDAR